MQFGDAEDLYADSTCCFWSSDLTQPMEVVLPKLNTFEDVDDLYADST